MKNNKVFLFIIIGIYIIVFFAILQNSRTPYLWYDEAGQFFISKGLNHDSNPFEKERGLTYVIDNNSLYNMDPGGFSILLHFWSSFSNHHIWLRLLPFLFFIGVVISFIYLSYLWLKNLNIALLMGFIPILIPVILSMGFEIRAYSMESMGTIVSIVALEKIKNKFSYKSLLLWSCLLSFFMTSRYSEIIVVFIVSVCVLYLIYNSSFNRKQKQISAIIYTLPLLTTLICIYFFALIYQNKNLEPLGYLKYLSNDIHILFDIENFIFICIIGVLTILFLLKKRYQIIKKYETLLFVTIFVNIAFIILSFLGKHPWTPFGDHSNRCISLFLLVILCVTAFFGELIKPLFLSTEILKYYFVVSSLVFVLYINKESLFIRQTKNNTYYDIMNNTLLNYNRIYVDRYESPCIRYLFEYGQLKTKQEGIYPNKFTFGKLYPHCFFADSLVQSNWKKTQPKMNDLLDYDLVISSELIWQGNNDKWKLINGATNFYIKK